MKSPILGILLSASSLVWPHQSALAEQAPKAPEKQLSDCAQANHKAAKRKEGRDSKKLANLRIQEHPVAVFSQVTSDKQAKPAKISSPVVVQVTKTEKKQTEKEKAPTDPHEAAIVEIDKCLTKASSKAKELAEVIRNAKKEKLVAEKDAKQSKDQLGEIQKQMNRVRKELASMKERETKNQKELKSLENKLAASAKEAEEESKKLLVAAASLTDWEKRARAAESDLQKTKSAMASTLKVANDAKALGARYQEKLTLGFTQLAERESTLSSTLESLKRSQEEASKCQARVTALQAELDKQSKRYETVAAALKKTESERDSYRKSKLASEKELTRMKGQLATMKGTADKLPTLEKKVDELQNVLAAQKQAEAAQVKAAKRLSESSEKMKARLNEILLQREELHDNLTILRNEFAQYRITAKSTQDRLSKESVNQLQASLAREGNKYEAELKKRDDRLAQLEMALKEKESALQATYKREKDAISKLSETAEARDNEAKARQSLTKALEQLRSDLESSEKKACKLKEQLVDLEKLSLEN